jgi:hypothetical protein
MVTCPCSARNCLLGKMRETGDVPSSADGWQKGLACLFRFQFVAEWLERVESRRIEEWIRNTEARRRITRFSGEHTE